ncbi:hypothetical protein A2875_04530 [Candidatus Gottesmanbacteria bacterium RIFCSPHIGHO2_01_FULL_46_14]|uniref:Lipoprotein with Yx(FWY)xxD motif n=2 Tax=Candidatus Gottesmaniibacteriota TaxID=1752720 RepID=A0A1F5ZJD2_9BACT|nr:MAG: hypothetical protein A2875_04530 [Candidatus Gottesmanbacteria bacterium RIFCSPHIGHO2_01_FULL_46_14]OGG29627.1 MAG: hypothetical protein A2971_01145 [Candidatus Gottesmanbacteria bacterium RIFCSPLOWO2_01_FULL_46_21]
MNKKTMMIVVAVVVVLGVVYLWKQSMTSSYTAPVSTITYSSKNSPAVTSDLYMTKTNAANGTYLTDPKGTSLYTYTKDTAGVSNCSGQCLANWPAFTTPSVPASLPDNMGTITRDDGTIQFTWKGMPLYFYVKDQAPGDVTGEGVGGVWYLAK